jgi:predicted glutamine amidotransferase
MTIQNNPLKQYFRRPAIYLKLPSGGKMYAPGVVSIPESGELAVYPMTAIDEISSKTPDALYNGTAMADIIKSCIPDIKDPWSINSIDLDAILIAIRAAAGGDDMSISSECPSCKEVAEYGVNLVGILSQLKSADYEKELIINELSIKFRPLSYTEMNEAGTSQMEAQRIFMMIEKEENETIRAEKTQEALKFITDVTMRILSNTITHIRTPNVFVEEKEYLLDFLRNCDRDTYVAIRDYNASLKAQTEIKPLKIRCIHCQNEYDQQFTLNTSDFFG